MNTENNPFKERQRISALLAAFDAKRERASIREQSKILDEFAETQNTALTESSGSQNTQGRVETVYRCFQEQRIVNREENIQSVLSRIDNPITESIVKTQTSKNNVVPFISTASHTQKEGHNKSLFSKQMLAIAAMLVLTLSTVLFFKNTPSTQPEEVINLALNKIIQSGELQAETVSAYGSVGFSFSGSYKPEAEAFILGVYSIDLPVYRASSQKQKVDNLINDFSRLFADKNPLLVTEVLDLSTPADFTIEEFRKGLSETVTRLNLTQSELRHYQLGRWIESSILASDVAISENDFSLIQTLLDNAPRQYEPFPTEINNVLNQIHSAQSVNDLTSTRQLHHHLSLIKGFF